KYNWERYGPKRNKQNNRDRNNSKCINKLIICFYNISHIIHRRTFTEHMEIIPIIISRSFSYLFNKGKCFISLCIGRCIYCYSAVIFRKETLLIILIQLLLRYSCSNRPYIRYGTLHFI